MYIVWWVPKGTHRQHMYIVWWDLRGTDRQHLYVHCVVVPKGTDRQHMYIVWWVPKGTDRQHMYIVWWYLRLQTHTHNMHYILLLYCTICYINAPHSYMICTLCGLVWRLSEQKGKWV